MHGSTQLGGTRPIPSSNLPKLSWRPWCIGRIRHTFFFRKARKACMRFNIPYLLLVVKMLFKNLIKSKILKKNRKKKRYFWAKFIQILWQTSERLLQILYSNIHSLIHSVLKGTGFNYVFTFSVFSSCQCSSEQVFWWEFSEAVTPNEVLKNCLREHYKYICYEYSN